MTRSDPLKTWIVQSSKKTLLVYQNILDHLPLPSFLLPFPVLSLAQPLLPIVSTGPSFYSTRPHSLKTYQVSICGNFLCVLRRHLPRPGRRLTLQQTARTAVCRISILNEILWPQVFLSVVLVAGYAVCGCALDWVIDAEFTLRSCCMSRPH